MKEIVETMTISAPMKQVYLKMAEIYTAKMPDSLYMNYYELETLTGHPSASWEIFLDNKEIEAWINTKISKLTEYNARAALQKLAKSNLNNNEISAIKELLAKSKLMAANQNQKPTVILTYIPQKQQAQPTMTPLPS